MSGTNENGWSGASSPALRTPEVRLQRLRYFASGEAQDRRKVNALRTSRNAAEEYSPGRLPWVQVENEQALKGRKTILRSKP